MPNLAQMYATVNRGSSFSRPDDIYPALSEAGFQIFAAVVKEFSGFFLKFDTSTIVLTPGQQVYTLPPDCDAIVNLAERLVATDNWHVINPIGLADALDSMQTQVGFDDFDDLYDNDDSDFGFYGPYLPVADVGNPQTAQTQMIRIAPAVDLVRMCEIAYTAKWIDIVSEQSFLVMPNEGTYAMQNMALAEIHRGNNDTLSSEYEAKAERQLTAFLTWVRNRQSVARPTVDAYLE